MTKDFVCSTCRYVKCRCSEGELAQAKRDVQLAFRDSDERAALLVAEAQKWERTARDAIALVDRLGDRTQRLRNVLDAVRGHILCGEGQRACQLIDQTLASFLTAEFDGSQADGTMEP